MSFGPAATRLGRKVLKSPPAATVAPLYRREDGTILRREDGAPYRREG